MNLNLVHVSGGRPFVKDLLQALDFELARLGVASTCNDDVWRDDATNVVDVSQLVGSVSRETWPSEEVLRRSVGLVLGRPGTGDFATTLEQSRRFGRVMAISRQAVDALRSAGVPATHLQLGYSAAWDQSADLTRLRDIAIATVGRYDGRRSRMLAAAAPFWWDVTTHHAVSQADAWDTPSGPRAASDLLSRTEVVVNVHREFSSGLEWLRAVIAASNGAVLVSEHSDAVVPLVPGQHFISATVDTIPAIARGLLTSPGVLEQYREVAYTFLRTHLPLSRGVEDLLHVADSLASSGGAVESPTQSVADAPPPAHRVPGWVAPPTGHELIVEAIRRLQRATRAQARQISRLELGIGPHDEPIRDWYETPSWQAATPRVSVIVPLHNYAVLVGNALESLLACDGVDFEVLVQDDGSTDGSFAVVEALLEQYPWLPARVERMPINQGLSATRNDLAKRARGEYVFNLDADNGVYPTALTKLASALDSDQEAAFAYPIIARLRGKDPESVMGWESWNPRNFRQGNHIDAMAMVRRTVLKDFAGWSTAMDMGWEDFHLWVRLAEHGHRGVHVPEVLCWYRASDTSMLSTTLLETASLWTEIRAAAPVLMADDPKES